jgi:hypothetical protein
MEVKNMAKNHNSRLRPDERRGGQATQTMNKCKKYEMAITHYVTGEPCTSPDTSGSRSRETVQGEHLPAGKAGMGITKEALFEHLKGCKNCRRDLTEWQDTYAVMCAESFSKTPQGQAKMEKDLTALKDMMSRIPPACAVGTADRPDLSASRKTTCLPVRERTQTGQNHTRATQRTASQSSISPKGKIVSVEELFSGQTGIVRKTIGKHGIVNFDELPAKSNLPPGIAYGAMVLLAQKKELCFIEHKDHVDIFLPL